MFNEKDAEVKYIIFVCEETEILIIYNLAGKITLVKLKQKGEGKTASNVT